MSKRAKTPKDPILVVAAEPQIQMLLKSRLEANGYQVLLAVDVATAIKMHAHHPQLVVLDLDLMNGSGAIDEMRRFPDVPIIALSSRRTEAALVAALDLGADDYIEKPLRMGEMLARVRSVLRRGFRGRGEEAVFRFGPLEVNILDHVVRRYGEPIRLASTTFEILSLLVRNMGRLVPYQQFIHPPSGKYCCANKRALITAMCALRKAIEDDPNNPILIKNELGLGYRLIKSTGVIAGSYQTVR